MIESENDKSIGKCKLVHGAAMRIILMQVL